MQLTVIQALGLGWSVIPVGLDKRPFFKWQQYQSSKPDKRMLSQWRRQYNPPAWAVVTGAVSGIVVLDFDGEEGAKTLTALGLEPHVRTGSGGYHVYVEHPGFPVKTLNSKSKQELGRQYPGLDIRADGGYAVFCGRNNSGKYTWLRDPAPYSLNVLPTEMKRELGLTTVDEQTVSLTAKRAVEALLAAALLESEGGRNDAGFRLARGLRDNGCSRDEAESVMLQYQRRTPTTNAKGTAESYTKQEALASLDQAYSGLVTIKHESDDGDDHHEPAIKTRPWPEPLAPESFHGLAGDFVGIVEPHTEADPAALLFSFFVAFGSVVGRSAFFVAEADKHYTNLFVVQVGMTAKGRKGSSLGQVLRPFKEVDLAWASDRVQSGLSSGEGLIWAVRDPIGKEEPVREGKQVVDYQTVVVDQGVSDKRLLVTEGEFAGTLRVLGREGNTLSAVIRNAWDSGDLRALTKTSQAKSTGAHISIIGHITRDELLRYMDSTEAGNGFGNRFLWVCVRRSKVLPEGGCLRAEVLRPIIDRLNNTVSFARGVGEMTRDDTARRLWQKVYPELSEGKPGLLGAVVARAEAQVMRLACIYALLDCSPVVHVEHLKAGLAVWNYSDESAKFIFGDSLGDPVADEILKALKDSPAGLSRTQISNHFGRNRSAREIARALSMLLERGLVRRQVDTATDGRNRELWFSVTLSAAPPVAGTGYEINELNEKGPQTAGLNSLNSFNSYAAGQGASGDDAEWEEGVI